MFRRSLLYEPIPPPTHVDVLQEPEILQDEVLSGFIAQAEVGTPAPRGMAMVYEALGPALENVNSGLSEAQPALELADDELERMLDEAIRADPYVGIEGYRTIDIEFDFGSGEHEILVDGEILHKDWAGETSIDEYSGCISSYSNETTYSCALSGMIPNQEHSIEVRDSSGIIQQFNSTSDTEDIVVYLVL